MAVLLKEAAVFFLMKDAISLLIFGVIDGNGKVSSVLEAHTKSCSGYLSALAKMCCKGPIFINNLNSYMVHEAGLCQRIRVAV